MKQALIESLLLLIAVGLISAAAHYAGRQGEHDRFVAYKQEQQRKADEALAAKRIEDQRRTDAAKEVQHVAQIAMDHHDADLVAAAASHQRLLDAARSRAAALDSPVAGGCGLRTPPPDSVPTIVLGRLDDAAGEIADFADQLDIALRACQASYRSLTPSP